MADLHKLPESNAFCHTIIQHNTEMHVVFFYISICSAIQIDEMCICKVICYTHMHVCVHIHSMAWVAREITQMDGNTSQDIH